MTIQKLLGAARRAVEDYRMVEEGDRICVGVSGGKDSLTLAAVLKAYQRFSPHRFELTAVNVDLEVPGTSGDEQRAVAEYFQKLEVPYVSVKSGIYDILFNVRKETNPCALCSKMRRGMLNDKAVELGCNKLALGHHADDLVETFLLSLCYEGRLSTFQPVSYMSRSGITLIRPLLYAGERDIAAFAKSLPVLHNPCPADKHTKRQYMKELIARLQQDIPFCYERMFSAITHPERYNLFEKPEENPPGTVPPPPRY